jgi:CRISPR-associated endonuclease/helicase Cas3
LQFPIDPGALWAKRHPRNEPSLFWHPLADHCFDVAACASALMESPFVQARLSALSGQTSFPGIWRKRLTVLAFLHDFGKANRSFQCLRGSHIAEGAYLAKIPELCRQAGLHSIDPWSPGGAAFLASVALAHHGAPPDFDRVANFHESWRTEGASAPIEAVADLVRQARDHWPDAFDEGGAPLPDEDSPFWHGFLGLLQLADWLGSDRADDAFPFTEKEDSARLPFALDRARKLLSLIGFGADEVRNSLEGPLVFDRLADFAPSDIQLAVAEAPGPVVILEAETGAGKTEAALWRFVKLFHQGKVDGLYFALPTRVAASQIHQRVTDAVKRLFGANAPEVLRAVPGDVRMNEASARRLADFDTQWSDEPGEELRRARWAAEQPKRFLAATIAVGTIDQALLGAVRVKHAQMRSFSLSRSLLVVDEVHASDFYMERLLSNLLDQHQRAGGEALLLSATLGAGARTRLLLGDGHKSRKKVPTPADAAQQAYPSLAWREDGDVRLVGKESRGRTKTVEVAPLALIADPASLAARALHAAEAGTRVLVVRNTVKDAVAVARALENLAPDHKALFSLDGVATLHHGRFARVDRARLDEEIERRLGKGVAAKPLVLVGTQTLEQSLDIDADLLICDLAPIDVLLQRIGRLHRHDRTDRAKTFATPRAEILIPEDFGAALAAKERRGPHGFGSVYENLLALAAAKETIGAGAVWTIPAMNRALVEGATHAAILEALAERLGAQDERWRNAHADYLGKGVARNRAADIAAIKWREPVSKFKLEEVFIGTRLGLRDLDVELATATPSPFPKSPPIQRLHISAHLLHTSPGDVKAVDVAPCDDGFTFQLGETALHYGRFGLERI